MSDMEGPDDPGKQDEEAGSAADPIIGQAVGARLKSLFDEFTSEDVPDRFMDLIEQLERSEKAETGSDGTISDQSAGAPASNTGKGDT